MGSKSELIVSFKYTLDCSLLVIFHLPRILFFLPLRSLKREFRASGTPEDSEVDLVFSF
jgi:hypothetical protein